MCVSVCVWINRVYKVCESIVRVNIVIRDTTRIISQLLTPLVGPGRRAAFMALATCKTHTHTHIHLGPEVVGNC